MTHVLLETIILGEVPGDIGNIGKRSGTEQADGLRWS